MIERKSDAVSRVSGSSWLAMPILTGLCWVIGPAGESCPSTMIMVVGVVFSRWSVKASVESALLTELPWLLLSNNSLVTIQFFRLPSVISISTKCKSTYSGLGSVSESLTAAEECPGVTLKSHRFPTAAAVPSSSQLLRPLLVSLGTLCSRGHILCTWSITPPWCIGRASLGTPSCIGYPTTSALAPHRLAGRGAWGAIGRVPRAAGVNTGLGLKLGFMSKVGFVSIFTGGCIAGPCLLFFLNLPCLEASIQPGCLVLQLSKGLPFLLPCQEILNCVLQSVRGLARCHPFWCAGYDPQSARGTLPLR